MDYLQIKFLILEYFYIFSELETQKHFALFVCYYTTASSSEEGVNIYTWEYMVQGLECALGKMKLIIVNGYLPIGTRMSFTIKRFNTRIPPTAAVWSGA